MGIQTVLSLVLLYACVAVSDGSHCSWANITCSAAQGGLDIPKPQLGFIFLHMRKAGGTQLWSVLNQWLLHHSCITENEKPASMDHLVNGYIRRQMNANTSGLTDAVCPNVNILNNEYFCIRSDRINSLPPVTDRQNMKLSIFTFFRDPIEVCHTIIFIKFFNLYKYNI